MVLKMYSMNSIGSMNIVVYKRDWELLFLLIVESLFLWCDQVFLRNRMDIQLVNIHYTNICVYVLEKNHWRSAFWWYTMIESNEWT